MIRVGRPYLAGAVAALAFGWISVWNGYPLVYEDTQSYLERPATAAAAAGIDSPWANYGKVGRIGGDRPANAPSPAKGYDSTFKVGRSIYYGIPAYLLDLAGGLWAVVAAQALLLGIVLALLWYRCLGLGSDAGFAGMVAVMATATSAGLFANLVMPDLLGGVVILALGMLLAFWPRLTRGDRWFLGIVAVIATTAHDSHLLLAVGVVGAAAVAWRVLPARWREAISGRALGVGAAVVVIGIVAGVAFGIAVRSITGQNPARLPHLTAHLVGKPVLAEFLGSNCGGPAPAWAVCAYRQRLPLVWTDFLFERRPGIGTFAAAGSRERLAISEQDVPLMLAVTRFAPLETAGMIASDAARQLVSFSYDDLSPRTKTTFIDTHFPPAVRDRIHASRLWRDDSLLWSLSSIEQIGVVLALPVLAAGLVMLARRGDADTRRLLLLVALVGVGVVANAFVCGGLASPYDRFQARVVWLVPLLAMCVVAVLVAARRSGSMLRT